MSNASFMELLTENANLSKKIALLEQDSNLSQHHANSQDFNSSHPLKKELTIAERKIQDLRQVWYLTIHVGL